MVHARRIPVAHGMIGASGQLLHPYQYANRTQQFGTKLPTVFRQKPLWAAPRQNKVVHEDVNRADCGELRDRNIGHRSLAAQAIRNT